MRNSFLPLSFQGHKGCVLQLLIIPMSSCRLGMCSSCNPGVCTQLNLRFKIYNFNNKTMICVPSSSLSQWLDIETQRFSKIATPKFLLLLKLYSSDVSLVFAQTYFFQIQIWNTNCVLSKYCISLKVQNRIQALQSTVTCRFVNHLKRNLCQQNQAHFRISLYPSSPKSASKNSTCF